MGVVRLILQILILLGVGTLVVLFKQSLPAYLAEKGKNLATKQDVEEITRKIETVKAEIGKGEAIQAAKRQLKYEACMEALSVIDAHFAQLFTDPKPTPQPVDTAKARECHNKLILSCEEVAIVELFGEIFFGPRAGQAARRPPTDLLNEFRNMIRHELGFGSDLPLDRERAWVGRATGDPNNPE